MHLGFAVGRVVVVEGDLGLHRGQQHHLQLYLKATSQPHQTGQVQVGTKFEGDTARVHMQRSG